jgi:hypothetical protein
LHTTACSVRSLVGATISTWYPSNIYLWELLSRGCPPVRIWHSCSCTDHRGSLAGFHLPMSGRDSATARRQTPSRAGNAAAAVRSVLQQQYPAAEMPVVLLIMRLKLSWGKTGETMVDVDKPHSVTRCISFHQDYLSDLSNALIGPHRQVINFVHICCWTRLSHTDRQCATFTRTSSSWRTPRS